MHRINFSFVPRNMTTSLSSSVTKAKNITNSTLWTQNETLFTQHDNLKTPMSTPVETFQPSGRPSVAPTHDYVIDDDGPGPIPLPPDNSGFNPIVFLALLYIALCLVKAILGKKSSVNSSVPSHFEMDRPNGKLSNFEMVPKFDNALKPRQEGFSEKAWRHIRYLNWFHSPVYFEETSIQSKYSTFNHYPHFDRLRVYEQSALATLNNLCIMFDYNEKLIPKTKKEVEEAWKTLYMQGMNYCLNDVSLRPYGEGFFIPQLHDPNESLVEMTLPSSLKMVNEHGKLLLVPISSQKSTGTAPQVTYVSHVPLKSDYLRFQPRFQSSLYTPQGLLQSFSGMRDIESQEHGFLFVPDTYVALISRYMETNKELYSTLIKSDVDEKITILRDFFRSFTNKAVSKDTVDDNVFKDILFNQSGVCRHRSFVAKYMFRYFDIPCQMWSSQTHSFLEIYKEKHDKYETHIVCVSGF